MRNRRDMRDHVSGVAAVAGHAADFVHILARERIVAAAAAAISARTAEPTDACPRADGPAVHALPDRVDEAYNFVARNTRILDDRKQALNRHNVAVADAAGLDANAYFLRTRGGNVPFFRYEWPATLPNDHRPHLRHFGFPSINCGQASHTDAA
jgi:hypothetical protein